MTYADAIALEKVSQSSFSPGIVDDKETIARVLVSPKHVLEGEVLSRAFYQIKTSPMSVLRKNTNFSDSLDITIKQLTSSENKYAGYVLANTSDIRNIFLENDTIRLFYILDSGASEEKKAHADVYSTRSLFSPKKWQENYMLLLLSEAFTEYVSA